MHLLLKLSCSVALLGMVACGSSPSEQPPAAASNDAAAAVGNDIALANNAQESIRARQTHYKQIGKAMKAISDEVKKGSPSVPLIQENARTINTFAPQIQGWFPDGSGAEAGLKTAARAEIWQKPELFREKAAGLVAAAATFERVAASGDVAAIKAGVPELGKTCKGCHDEFRLEDD